MAEINRLSAASRTVGATDHVDRDDPVAPPDDDKPSG
jgi:hypothetical protein